MNSKVWTHKTMLDVSNTRESAARASADALEKIFSNRRVEDVAPMLRQLWRPVQQVLLWQIISERDDLIAKMWLLSSLSTLWIWIKTHFTHLHHSQGGPCGMTHTRVICIIMGAENPHHTFLRGKEKQHQRLWSWWSALRRIRTFYTH